MSKPLSWKGDILTPPASPRAVDGGGGSLAGGTHYFAVVALLETGPVLAQSLPSPETTVSLGAGRTATVTWNAVPGAERYRIYRGTSGGALSRYIETPDAATSVAYSGAGEQAGTPPSSATEWVIKNLIEFKNVENVLVDGNLLENVWAAGQNGYAIVITPRNQSGGASWVRVRDVTFSNNIIRNAAGVLTLTGYDDLAPSQQTKRIAFRNNLIYDIDPVGGWAKVFVMGLGPATVVFDHNTIIHRNTSVLFAYGPTIWGLTFTNNLTTHDAYGIMGNGGRPGSYSIDMYFPDGVVTHNVLAGGVASAYPSPNAFPSVAEFQASFVDPANDDYRVRSSSPFYTAGSGGTVPGVDFGQLNAALGGTPPPASPTAPPPSSNTPPVARPGGPYASTPGAPFVADGSASSDAEGPIATHTWWWHDDIVIYAADIAAGDIAGTAWTRVARGDAAGGAALSNPDRGAAKITTPAAAPASYVDVRFYAAAGVPYRLWMRARADADSYTNDSLYLQFSGRVDSAGRALDRIGTSSAASMVLEEGNGAGLAGWGWNDDDYGGVAAPIYFATSGPQTIRVQQREDGIMWDQIVLSAATFASTAPGSTRGDTTIVPRSLGSTSAAVTSHAYDVAGVYPVVLTVQDAAGLSASAVTTASIGGGGGGLAANAGGPYTGTTGNTVSFAGTASGASSSAQYLWRFGDHIVLDPGDMAITGSRWQRVPDASAATGAAIHNADWQQPKLTSATASPASYVEASFQAAAGVPYRLWIRMRADGDSWTNDSIYVQFSGSVTAGGAAVHRIGSGSAMGVVLEDGNGAGVLGWGWADGGYGVVDAPIYFNSDGDQRIRIQQREDGVRIDQIVISADTYAWTAPGATKQDATIVPVFPTAARGATPSHRYRFAGVFPVQLIVADGSRSASATTTATVR